MLDGPGQEGSPAPLPWVVVVAASAGGLHALRSLLSGLPANLRASVVIVLHRTPTHDDSLVDIFARATPLPVVRAQQDQSLEPGIVYLARPDLHLTVSPEKRFQYTDGTRIKFVRSSANPLFETAARAFDGRSIAIVLSGTGSDGTDGVQAVKAHGGIVIAQDQATAEHWNMPEAAVKSGAVDYVLPVADIAAAVTAMVRGQAVSAGQGPAPASG
jgi:two-component system chemotaxis response regulator CheB